MDSFIKMQLHSYKNAYFLTTFHGHSKAIYQRYWDKQYHLICKYAKLRL